MYPTLNKILLIDDEPAMAWLVNDFLQTASQNRVGLATAETVTEGLQRLAQGDIKVLLLDLSLPDSLGPETFSKVHSQFPDVPVVVFTSMEDEELGSRLVQLGAQDYLVKGQINGPTLLRTLRYAVERKQIERERDRLIQELQQALAEVKKLGGLLPICSSCKKIRDDQGYWHQVEQYITARSEAQFSHGVCEDCMRQLYPELAEAVIASAKAKSQKPTPPATP